MILNLQTNVSGLKFRYDGFNLLVGNHYLSPNSDSSTIETYFNSLETKLDIKNFRVVLLGDFNFPGYDWVNGFPEANQN
jgi:hypothetical protein